MANTPSSNIFLFKKVSTSKWEFSKNWAYPLPKKFDSHKMQTLPRQRRFCVHCKMFKYVYMRRGGHSVDSSDEERAMNDVKLYYRLVTMVFFFLSFLHACTLGPFDICVYVVCEKRHGIHMQFYFTIRKWKIILKGFI